ncbi:MAG: hypothetical protein IPP46_04785 [Bacteroidetes bacterium]|nr:hypothetical protein [Bacteroidota bacterium]
MMNTDQKIFHKLMVVLLFIVTMPALTIAQSLVLTDWSFRRLSTDKWLPAQVPGSVHTDLVQNGIITDPFKNDHEKKCSG